MHDRLGPGLLESAYEALLAAALAREGLIVERQKSLDLTFDGLCVPDAFRVDLLVERKLLIELKSTDRLLPVHVRQVLTYLRLAELPLGLLMNFGAGTFREGIKRVVNRHENFASSRLRVHNP